MSLATMFYVSSPQNIYFANFNLEEFYIFSVDAVVSITRYELLKLHNLYLLYKKRMGQGFFDLFPPFI